MEPEPEPEPDAAEEALPSPTASEKAQWAVEIEQQHAIDDLNGLRAPVQPEPLDAFMCPIGHDVMVDPVIDPEGNSYERTAIELWLRSQDTSPLTGATLASKQLIPQFTLRSLIQQWHSSADAGNTP